MVARKLLELREGEIAQGKLPGIHFDKVSYDELAEDFLLDYELNQRKSMQRAQICVDHLNEFFEGLRVIDITTARIKAYIKTRRAEKAANATINRELAALKRMLSLGAQDTLPKVDRVPHVPMLKERNVRQGFFEHGEYMALLKALPFYLRGLLTFGYSTGWRKGEITGLTWDRVDLEEGTVRLEADETKNSEARTVYLDSELLKLMKVQKLRTHRGCNHVFHRDGERIRDFRGAWQTACKDAKIEGKLFHDLRRTAVRNMVRAGIP
ncbi:MAG: tyrosine-type recombinase/integrase, partial [Deltaproteobacteria bacterium]|nr:tyrosine-type recombinase/integrase [Deltaproteobacteria bacterium]